MLNVSSAYLDAIKQGSRTVNASIGYDDKSMTNLVANGDFSEATGWTNTTSTNTVTNGELIFTSTASGGYISKPPSTATVVGNVYYLRAKIKGTVNPALIQFGFTGRTRATYSGSGDYEYVSQVISATTTAHNMCVQDTRGSAWTPITVDDVTCLNLTATYGAGYEPTKAYMDALFNRVGYFNATKNLPSQFLGDRIVLNALANGDFSNGTSNWYAGQTTLSASANVLSLTGTGGQAYQYVSQTGFNIPTGNKVYARVKAKATNALCTRFMLYCNAGAAGYQFANQYTPVNGTQYTMSGVIEALAPLTQFNLIGYYANTTDATGSVVQLQEFSVIDLTAMFGKGNEPSQAYMDSLFTSGGWFKSRLLMEDFTVLCDFNIDSSLGNGNLPSIGSTISNKLTLEIINDMVIPQTLIGKTLRPYVGIDTTGNSVVNEWVKLGEFKADYDGVDIGKLTTTLEAFDMMAAYMNTPFNPTIGLVMTVQGVLDELATTHGLRFATQTGLPTTTAITIVPKGSIRQVLSEMASLMSTNATMDADGCVKFVFMNTIPQATFEMGLDNYSDFKLQPDSIVSFTELILADGNNEVPWGYPDLGYSLSFKNDQVKLLDDVKTIYNRIFPINYYAYTMKAQGMPHLELGDVVTFTYLKLDGSTGVITIPILKHKFTFKGGMVSEFSASAPQQQTTSVTVTSGSSLADAVDVTYADLNESIAMANKLITGNQGGYVTTILNNDNQPQEIVISNTPDYNTADKVWRWNASGLAFGTSFLLADGGTNPVGIALTADGKINATRMTTGVLDANLIKAGVIKDVTNQTWIDMTNGRFSFGGGKLAWNGTALTINFAGTSVETELNKKVDDTEFSPFASNISFADGMIKLGKAGNPFSVNITNQAVEFIDTGTTGGTLNITSITGNGSAITIGFAPQAVIPYQQGGYLQISGCSVSAYNGTYPITSCSKTQVVLQGSATGTVSSGFGVIQYGSSPNTVAYINGQKMFISDLQTTSSLQVGNHQITKYDSNITLIKYSG